MIALYRFFLNPYEDPQISIAELSSYALAQLDRMVANNPGGQLDAIIAATSNLLDPLEVAITNETVRLGIQKATTQAKNAFRASLPQDLSKIHGACLAAYGRNAPKMTEIFPGGLSAFSDADDNELDNHLEALVTALTANLADVGQQALDLATLRRDAWDSLYSSSGSSKSTKLSQAEIRREAASKLRGQLFQNLLKLAALFPGDEGKANLYCPQHLLENPEAPAPDPAPAPAP